MDESNSGPITAAEPINADVQESAPAHTGSAPVADPTPAPQAQPQEAETTEQTEQVESTETGEQTELTESEQQPTQDYQYVTPEMLQQLQEAQQYRPQERELDIVDDYGNLDPAKFQSFMAENNQNIFDQALNAFQARSQAESIEQAAWGNVRKDYAQELQANPNLEKLLRGARIQDLISGGDGDLTRLSKEVIGPMRSNAIKAVEDVNRQVTEAEQLGVYKPNNTAPAAEDVPLMTQLQQAVSNGDHARATALRHAIRKERISGNN